MGFSGLSEKCAIRGTVGGKPGATRLEGWGKGRGKDRSTLWSLRGHIRDFVFYPKCKPLKALSKKLM